MDLQQKVGRKHSVLSYKSSHCIQSKTELTVNPVTPTGSKIEVVHKT